MMLSCVLALGLSACGKSDSSGEAENKTAVPASETADCVRSAMDAADHLYGSYLLAGDGSIITLRDTSYQDVALGYASLEGVRKLCVSPSESHPFALTEGGDLYAAGSAADVSCIPVCAGRDTMRAGFCPLARRADGQVGCGRCARCAPLRRRNKNKSEPSSGSDLNVCGGA